MQSRAVVLAEGLFKSVSSLLIAGLVVITFVDVVGRQFGAPLAAAFELTQIAVGAMFYVALPFVTLRREHVVVDILPFDPNTRIGRGIGFLVDLLSAAAVAFAAQQLWAQADTLDMFNSVTMFLNLPTAPIVRAMAVLCGFTALICLVLAMLHLRGADKEYGAKT